MTAAMDRYSYTATGVLGDKRQTMLENEIHQRSQLAKAKTHCHHLPPNMTMGMRTERDYTALPKAFSWNEQPSSSALLSRPRQCSQRDFLALNRAALRSGCATARQSRDFRATHDIRRPPPSERRPPQQLQDEAVVSQRKNLSFGVSTRPSTPIQELISHRFQNEWVKDQVDAMQAKAASTPKKPLMCQPYETRASMLRSCLMPLDAADPATGLWKLPRFERRARSRLDTFRSGRQRSLAFELHEAEQADRMGERGLGLYVPSTK